VSQEARPGRERTNGGAAEDHRSRRSALYWLAVTLGGVAFAEMAWVAASFLKPRKRTQSEQGNTLVVAGAVDSFEVNSVTAFQRGKFYLVRLEDGGFLALHRRCTHLGCTVPWDEEARRFACPCHASSFDLRGDVLSPPAPRALDLFPVRIENDVVKVETSRPITRKRFDSSQVARA
jgi:cytochrome b6-f complex iron-sulfur subunit